MQRNRRQSINMRQVLEADAEAPFDETKHGQVVHVLKPTCQPEPEARWAGGEFACLMCSYFNVEGR